MAPAKSGHADAIAEAGHAPFSAPIPGAPGRIRKNAHTDRPEQRYKVDFPLYASIDTDGRIRRSACRCTNLSVSGLCFETKDRLPVRARVVIEAAAFGRMGTGTIRYCLRDGMKYNVGVHFAHPFQLEIEHHISTRSLRWMSSSGPP